MQQPQGFHTRWHAFTYLVRKRNRDALVTDVSVVPWCSFGMQTWGCTRWTSSLQTWKHANWLNWRRAKPSPFPPPAFSICGLFACVLYQVFLLNSVQQASLKMCMSEDKMWLASLQKAKMRSNNVGSDWASPDLSQTFGNGYLTWSHVECGFTKKEIWWTRDDCWHFKTTQTETS